MKEKNTFAHNADKNDLKMSFYEKIDAYWGTNISILLRYASLFD